MTPHRTRWPFFVALVLGVASVAILSYFMLVQPNGEAVPASGGQYTEGVTQAADRINPLFTAGNQTNADIASLVFSGLVRLGPDGTPEPDLASRWEITGNGQSYVFHLRQGVAWQDGEPFTSDDVVFTFRAIADANFKGDPALAQLMQGVVVTARDPLTVEFKLEQAYAPFLAYLTVGILPRHLLDGMDANQLFNAPFNSKPVGTGPYAFKRSDDGGVTLESNSTYYLGPPKISTIVFKTFADEPALVAALRQRSIDGALLASPAKSELDLLRSSAYALRPMSGSAYDIVYLDTRSPIFSDQHVRAALQQALDLPALIAVAGGGQPARVVAGIPTRSWAFTKGELPAFDPGGAAAALERAGWSRQSNGVRSNGGQALAFTLSTPNDPRSVALAEEIAREWRSIGADTKVQALDASTYVADQLLQRTFQAALAVVDPGPDPDPYPFWHSSQIAAPGRNLAGYTDPRIDDVLERARQTTDTQRRKDLYAQFQSYFVADLPAIPLFAPASVYVQSTRVQGFRDALLFTPASRFGDVAAWYIDTRAP
ncbi:MAG: peptide ABC transporter substrate-binding protein [Dehalococcoidia bacterium]|nr:peptide ABC transporter substrate-binding protein [Dehalococcoidia bacterium]